MVLKHQFRPLLCKSGHAGPDSTIEVVGGIFSNGIRCYMIYVCWYKNPILKTYFTLLQSNLDYYNIICEVQAMVILFLGEIQAFKNHLFIFYTMS